MFRGLWFLQKNSSLEMDLKIWKSWLFELWWWVWVKSKRGEVDEILA